MTSAPKPKAGILNIAAYTPGKSKASGGSKLMKLSSNENPLGCSPAASAAFSAQAGELHRYPNAVHEELRQAIGEAYRVPADLIVCGAGSDELIHLLTQAYVGAGDEVIYTEHGFLMYKIAATAVSATPVPVPEKELRTDVDAILNAVNEKTKLIFLANPNNPTGSYISALELHRLHAELPAHVLLVVDGAYEEYVQAQDYSDGSELVAAGHKNVVVLHTFSKIHGLPGLRLGWSYACAEITDVLNRIRGPFNISSPALAAGIAAVKDKDFIDNTIAFNAQWREWLSQGLNAIGLKVYPSVANFILVEFPESGAHTAALANQYLSDRGIVVREVSNYGLPRCLRITIGTEEENNAVYDTLSHFMKS